MTMYTCNWRLSLLVHRMMLYGSRSGCALHSRGSELVSFSGYCLQVEPGSVLILTPAKNAVEVLRGYFDNLQVCALIVD